MEPLSLFFALFLGIAFGTITGIIPGLHINLVAALLLSLSPLLLQWISPLLLVTFLVSMAITHTFLDTLPSVYLGAPDEGQILNVLPGHRLLLQGKGHSAVMYILIGSFGSLLTSLLFLPLFVVLMKHISSFISPLVGFLLLGMVLFLLWREKKKIHACAVFLLAGALGVRVLSLPQLHQPLFPLLSGLFGCSLLFNSLFQNTKVPVQTISKKVFFSLKEYFPLFSFSSGAGFLAAFLPGLSTSQMAVLGTAFTRKVGNQKEREGEKEPERFLVFTGGIATAGMLISFGTWYVLGKARNGAVAVAQELLQKVGIQELILFLSIALVAGGSAFLLTLFFSRVCTQIIHKVPYRRLVEIVLFLILLLTLLIDGPIGMVVLFTATALGLIASFWNIPRHHLMGCLLLPVILYFIL